jgi:hypothetical protein
MTFAQHSANDDWMSANQSQVCIRSPRRVHSVGTLTFRRVQVFEDGGFAVMRAAAPIVARNSKRKTSLDTGRCGGPKARGRQAY